MNILNFNIYSFVTIGFWTVGLYFLFFPLKDKYSNLGYIITILGTVVLSLFMVLFWIKIKQPNFRTITETFIWISLLISISGFIIFLFLKYKWFLIVCHFISLLILIYILFNKSGIGLFYKPILQSKWFIPHVLIYLSAYALLSCAFIFNIIAIFKSFQLNDIQRYLRLTDLFVITGFILLSLGLIFGAFWAKDAWGHYWTWDVKQSWSLLTWIIYLIYIHLQYYQPSKYKINLWIILVAYLVLLISWVGYSILPTTLNSMHNFQ